MDDYKTELKGGKMLSFLSCIPEMICFDLKADSDEFVLLSTDGIFSGLDIADVVIIINYMKTTFIRERYDRLEM